jgi:hypothetical protein
VLPREQAIAAIKDAIRETYGKRGEAAVDRRATGCICDHQTVTKKLGEQPGPLCAERTISTFPKSSL